MTAVGQPLPRGSFSAWVPISKAYESEDGKEFVFEGPLSEPGKDIEGDRINQPHLLEKGMALFDRFGGPVDWDHQYAITHEPKWLIGKGLPERFTAPHPSTGEDVPFMRTRLFKGKRVAQDAIEHYQSGGGLGYSIWGNVEEVYPDGSLGPAVAMVSMTPVPVATANAGTLRLCKSLAEGRLETLPLVPETQAQVEQALQWGRLYAALDRIAKALEASGALPKDGPGVDAAGVEDLGPEGKRKKRKGRPCAKAVVALGRAARIRAALA